jgi:histidine triad (HIT) family protein
MTTRPADCVFCGVVTRELPSVVIGETDLALAFLDIAPFTAGHTLVVPKRHVVDLVQADGALAEMADLVESTAQVLDAGLHPAGINLVQATRAPAGQTVFHLHVHLIPIYRGQGHLGEVLNRGHGEMVSADELGELRSHLLGLG